MLRQNNLLSILIMYSSKYTVLWMYDEKSHY